METSPCLGETRLIVQGDSRRCKSLQGEIGLFWKHTFWQSINHAKQGTKGGMESCLEKGGLNTFTVSIGRPVWRPG